MTTHGTTRDTLLVVAVLIVLGTVVPGFTHWLMWTTRLGPRGVVRLIAAETLVRFATLQFATPYFKRLEHDRRRLAARLGREPTDLEFFEHIRTR